MTEEHSPLLQSFYDTYLSFVTKLNEAFPENEKIAAELLTTTAVNIDSDFNNIIPLLSRRWENSIDSDRTAFIDDQDDSVFLSDKIKGMFADLDFNTIAQDTQTFAIIRPAVWKFIRKLTRLSVEINKASGNTRDSALMEQEATVRRLLANMGLKGITARDGRLGVDLSELVDPKNNEKLMRTLHRMVKFAQPQLEQLQQTNK